MIVSSVLSPLSQILLLGSVLGQRPNPFLPLEFPDDPDCSPEEVFCLHGACFDQTCDGILVQSPDNGRCQCKAGLIRNEKTRRCIEPAPNCVATTRRIIPTTTIIRTTTTTTTPQPQQDPSRATNSFTFPPEINRIQYLKKGGQLLLYRLYNVQYTDHMLTRYISEVTSSIKEYGYTFEGAIGRIAGAPTDVLVPCPNLKALKRLYKGVLEYDHFYTIKAQDAQIAAEQHAYADEGVAGYCVRPQGCGANVRLYRFYDPVNQNHYYSSSLSEVSSLSGQGEWVAEGVECYIWELF